MRVVVTGSSCGMGRSIAELFITKGNEVIGIDTLNCTSEFLLNSPYYSHMKCNIADKESLPDIPNVNILINNAGVQQSGQDIEINLMGLMYCTEKYALNNPKIVSVLNQSDVAAKTGCQFPYYVASKGGVTAYTRWTAKQIACYCATCNSLSVGGVITDLNLPVMADSGKWDEIMKITPMHKWATTKEIAQWAYFLTVVNKSCSGQDIVIDNLESLNGTFIWN